MKEVDGLKKAAILLISLGSETSAKIMKNLPDSYIQKVSYEIANIDYVNPEERDAVINEFIEMSQAREYVIDGGIDYAKNLLNMAIGPQRAKEVIDMLNQIQLRERPFNIARKADPQQLTNLLLNEQPQTVALILCYMQPEKAAIILAEFPIELQSEIAERIGTITSTSPAIIEKIEKVIENAIKNPDINFIGIEKFDSVLAKSLPKIPEGLDNLLIVRMDALNIDSVFSKEIDRIYLNFSDPWPKNRHHLRRLSSRVFLEKYDSIFRKDMVIYQRTDNQALYIYSLESYSEHGCVLSDISFDLHKDKDGEELITTEYEDKFSDKGMPIYSVVATKSV